MAMTQKTVLENVAFSLNATVRMFDAKMAMAGKCSGYNYTEELVKLLQDIRAKDGKLIYDDFERSPVDDDGIPTGVMLCDIAEEVQEEIVDKLTEIVGVKSSFALSCEFIKGPLGVFFVTELYADDKTKYV